MKGYWHKKKSLTPDRKYKTISSSPSEIQEPSNKDFSYHLKWIKNFKERLYQTASHLQKLQEFYQCFLESSFAQMKVRCYKHNSDFVLYCKTDSSLLCSNCAYVGSTHRNHQVAGVNEVLNQIQFENKTKKSEIIESRNKAKYSQRDWEDFQQQFRKIKEKKLATLDRCYEKQKKNLSTKYLKTKLEINEFYESFEENIKKIFYSYELFKKLACPDRYSLPLMKHAWFQEVTPLFSKVSFENNKNQGKNILNCFQTYSEQLIKKFIK